MGGEGGGGKKAGWLVYSAPLFLKKLQFEFFLSFALAQEQPEISQIKMFPSDQSNTARGPHPIQD